jgi:hypothetical protein
MSFLNKIYANRFEHNMQRHNLSARIAPPKPKPACRFVENEQKHELVTRFEMAQGQKEKTSPVVIAQTPPSPPPTYQEFFDPKSQLASTDSQLSLFEAQKPAPLKRALSQESGFCSNCDSSIQA